MILEKNQFDLPITGKENALFKEIYFKIIPKMRKYGQMSEDLQNKFIKFFDLLIKVGLTGLNKNSNERIQILTQLAFDQNCQTFNNNKEAHLDEKILELFKNNKIYDTFLEFLDKDDATISACFALSQVFISLQIYFTDFDIVKAFNKLFDAIVRAGKKNARLFVTSEVSKFKDIISQHFYNSNLCCRMMDIYAVLASCEIFDRQLYGYQMIQKNLENPMTQDYSLNWFSNESNLEILKRQELHPQIMPILATIISILEKENLLPFHIITELWNQNNVIHSSDLDSFYKMFLIIGESIQSKNFSEYISLVTSPDNKTSQWFNFIINLAVVFGKREDGNDPFNDLRSYICKFAFDDNSDFNDQAKHGLVLVLKYHITFDKIIDISKVLIENLPNECFYIMQKIIENVNITDMKLIMELLHMAFDQIMKTKNRKQIYEFLVSFCTKFDVYFDKDLCKLVFDKDQDSHYYDFLSKLIENALIDTSILVSFIMEQKNINFCSSFVSLLKKIVLSDIPEEGIDEYPIPHEELLWKFVKINSDQQNEIAEFLVKCYMRNDLRKISNNEMIDTFLEKWISENPELTDKMMINLLHLFITICEKKVDYEDFDLKPHLYEISPKVEIEVSFQKQTMKLIVSSRISISALTKRVCQSYGDYHYSFQLKMENSVLNPNKILSDYKLTSPVKMTLVQTNEQMKTRSAREYDELPSNVIYESHYEIVEKMIELIKNDDEEAKKLLDDLPTYKNTLEQINNIEDDEIFDYSGFLPLHHPLYFMYNFETLISSDKWPKMTHNGGFLYIIGCIEDSDNNICENIINFISKKFSKRKKNKYSQQILTSCLIRIANQFEDSEELLGPIFTMLSDLVNLNEEIQFPHDFDEIVSMILESDNSNIIENSQVFLNNKVPISQDIIIHSLRDAGHETKGQIYEILVQHLTDFDENLFEEIVKTLKGKKVTYLKPCLLCLKSLVQMEDMDENYKDIVCEMLIDKYLRLDSDRSDGYFKLVCSILSIINNERLNEHIDDIFQNSKSIRNWDTSGDIETKHKNGAGLINLGATCFFNSTLQQFYAIPQIRKSVIEYEGDNLILKELKELFSKLYYSERQSQSTEKLINSWVGWDGQKLNPVIQQDACEFLQDLLDKLEKGLGVDFVHSLFKGTTTHYTEGINEKYESQKTESFLTLTVPVKGSTNINDSFEQMSAPEFFTGQNKIEAEGLGKIDARRYAKQTEIPQFLIMQLSRFEYNYQTWQRIKIDTPFIFPINLLVNNSKYKLCGVIVHMGTAEFGHYVSYVRDRFTQKWTYFNDDQVSEISENDVLQTSYGSNTRSAYLLFYDKEGIEYENDIEIDEEIKTEIDEDNNQIQISSLIYSTPFYCLMRDLMNDLTLEYFLKYFPFTKHTEKASVLGEGLIKKMATDDTIHDRLKDKFNTGEFTDGMIYSPNEKVREYTLMLIKEIGVSEMTWAGASNFFSVMAHIHAYPQGLYPFFDLLYLCLENDEILENAREDNWPYKIHALLTKRIPDYCLEKDKNINEYYESIDIMPLINVLDLLSQMEDQDIINYLTSIDFVCNVLFSKTSLRKFVAILETYVEDFTDYITHAIANNAPLERITNFTFLVQPEDTVHYLLNLVCQISISNWLATFCLLAKKRMHVDRFIDSLKDWINYLASEDGDERITAYYLIIFLCPHKMFQVNLPQFPLNLQIDASDVTFTPQEDKQLVDRCLSILDCIHYCSEDLFSKACEIYSDSPNSIIPLINAIMTLCHAAGDTRQSDLLKELLDKLRGYTHPFDTPVEMILNKLATFCNFVKVADDFVSPHLSSKDEKLAQAYAGGLAKHLLTEGISTKCALILLKMYINIPRSSIYQSIRELFTLVCLQQPNVVRTFLNTEELHPPSMNFVLFLAKTAEVQFSALKLLSQSLSLLDAVNANKIVADCIKYNNGDLIEEELRKIANCDYVKDEAKEAVLKLLNSEELHKEEPNLILETEEPKSPKN
ncbi:Clan CA, family C19, ubiquitin hydrolase-like cysteine peptidase [Trichomonas vaginalis G3]|uniref:Clan CA, family C19, ubiquitin hydrolase-like cysteine peptidase n=1 Tax=Trichomonas vaginalis (strain ATCC PRA-98 / G3) TaxID=412133 RepID=A2DPH2_TRIV3|nr:ubiquitinyl hydrolase protein [Trichomonas vaginalis G3]EAY17716.1 Clan CA, family C19, ubiquitin hydrolase-like cysteine peptidase [Trichomonas vaginalis G3]KAI5507880.1 ubiquitinyl hydrolase protein [Trichomonas vaginalis G3]|eukprot:XP_001329851.1 Clan CA, family C19, ubiquitin hydrolase-like cysteine peptidase [Trichomonas vaginalis G3]